MADTISLSRTVAIFVNNISYRICRHVMI